MNIRNHSIRVLVALVVTLLCLTASGQSRISRMPITSGYALDGVLKPWKTSHVACVEAGLLESLNVKLGQQVTVGQPLAKIESSALEKQLTIVQAQAAATGRRAAAEADAELNRRRVEALSTARENRFSSQTELERAQADLKISQARLTSELEEQEVLRLQVARLMHQIKQRTVLAPIDGLVTQFHKELGEFVSPTSPEVVQIADVSRLRASFYLKPTEVEQVDTLEQVRVRLSDGSQKLAEVEYVAPVADAESGLIEVRVLLDNRELKILGSACTLILDPSEPSAPRA